MTYALLTYRLSFSRCRTELLGFARPLLAVALLLASGPSAEALDYSPFGDLLLFPHPADGRLWQTDGTPDGTSPFPPLPSGSCKVVDEASATAGEAAFFLCPTGLWSSDGTPEGTVRLTGPLGLVPDLVWWEQARRLFFTVDGSLWSSDGTPAGSEEIADVAGGLHSAAATSEALWWLAEGYELGPGGIPINRVTLWRTDGTPENTGPTVTLDEERSRSVYPQSPLLPVGDRLILVAFDSSQRQLIWSTDGTTGSVLLLAGPDRVFSPGTGPRDVYGSDGSRVFFMSQEESPGEPQIWATDGTIEGTRRLTELADVALLRRFFEGAEDPVFFAADDGVHGRELWMTDGTASGTHLFADLCPGSCSGDPTVTALRPGGPYFILAEDETGLRKPWWSDGTPAGTRLLADVCAGGCDVFADPVAVGDRVFFNAADSVHGEELWVSEGGGPARRVTDFAPHRPFDPRRDGLETRAAVGDRLVFDAFDHVHGTEPWVTDGTAAGTRLLVDLRPDDNAVGPLPPPPGIPKISRFVEGQLGSVAVLLRAAEGPVDSFILEIRSPTHDWRYAGNSAAVETDDGWLGGVGVLLTPGVPYTFRAKSAADDGRESAYGEPATFTFPVSSESTTRCTPGPHTLCLARGRFRVRVAWRNQHAAPDGQAVHGQAGAVSIPGSVRSGHFWFFRPDNVELVVKILDGSTVNGFHWTFYGALSDVEYWITVEDTAWGTSRTYYNPPGRI